MGGRRCGSFCRLTESHELPDLLSVLSLSRIVCSDVKTEAGDVYACAKPIRDFARQAAGFAWPRHTYGGCATVEDYPNPAARLYR